MDELSILDSVKQDLGITKEQNAFDSTLIPLINSVFDIFLQLGITKTSFKISDNVDTWDDADIETGVSEMAKAQMFSRVRIMFDPPSTAHVLEAANSLIKELEYRGVLAAEFTSKEV